MSDNLRAAVISPSAAQSALSFRSAAAAGAVILAVSAASLSFFYFQGLTNIYGDALTHMGGARRIFDSLTPGLGEVGSVWLPLYHLLVAPLAINNHLWRTGLAGSLVSVAAFSASAWFIFRLAFEMNGSTAAAAVALGGFLICPNMLYAASTPLTESTAILWAVLVVYGLFRYQMSGRMACVIGAAAAAFCGSLTRYDAWYVLPFAALFILLVRPEVAWERRLLRAVLFVVIAGTGPALWLLHNAHRYGNPFEFYNGPYSAQAIYAHQLATTAFRYPTDGSLLTAARYYMEDVKLVVGPWSLELAALGLVAWAADRRMRARRATALLLLIPLPFYVQSMARAAVPIYVPALFPYSYYNLRYGLELLPATAVLASFLLPQRLPRGIQTCVLVLCLAVFGAQGVVMLSKGAHQLPIVKEGIRNSPCRLNTDKALIAFFQHHYDGGRILMNTGEWPCVMPALGIPYRNTLGDLNHKYWLRLPKESESLVEWIVRGEGDAVDQLMRAYPDTFTGFKPVFHVPAPRQRSVTVYRREKG